MHIVWFKRDLRIQDHEALAQAAKHGFMLPLYILEPELWQQPNMSHWHCMFLQDCLSELSQALEKLGQKLIIKAGNAVDMLEELHESHSIDGLWFHHEIWNGWTYERDTFLKSWCKSHNIPWNEPVQNGVVCRLKDRDGWSARWYH